MPTLTRSSPSTGRQEDRPLRYCSRETPYKASWLGTWIHPDKHYTTTLEDAHGVKVQVYECNICGRWFAAN